MKRRDSKIRYEGEKIALRGPSSYYVDRCDGNDEMIK